MKLLVTGAAGFVGSHLSERLVSDGHEVVGLDNFETGSKENLKGLAGNTRFSFVELSVTDISPSPSPPKGGREWMQGIQGIFHLASPASPKDFSEIPVQIAVTNSVGTLRVLELAEKLKARVLMASTSECYGEPLKHPQNEEDLGQVSTTGPRSCYDEGKRFAEALCMAFVRSRNLDIRIVRIFNTYGPRLRLEDGRVLSNFFKQALSKEALTLYGEGQQTRSFCYVEDLVDGLVRAYMTEGMTGEVVNLGNDREISVAELASKVSALCGVPHNVKKLPLPHADDPSRRRPDLAKAKARLGYSPKISLEEGLKRCLPWYRGVLGK